MKKGILILWMGILVLSFLNFVFAGSDFVKVNGSEFYLNDKQFYFAGANSYYLFYADNNANCIDYGTHQGCLIPLLNSAKALNLTVIRLWGSSENGSRFGYDFQPSAGIYDEATFAHFDKVIKEASDRNLKLIVVLVNNWDSFGGMCQYVKWCALPNASLCQAGEFYPFPNAYVHDFFYTDNCTKQLYKNYVAYILNRTNTLTGIKYKDDPTIFAWELANEPRARSDKNCIIINDWIGEMSAYVKSIDSKHLVTPGVDGGYKNKIPDINPWWYQCNEGQDYIPNHNWNTIDFTTFNYYDDSNRFDVDQFRWFSDHISEARNILNKPVVLQEFNTINNTSRAQILSQWFLQLQSLGLNGDTIWMLSDFRGADADGFEFLCPQDLDICSAVSNHANFMNNKSMTSGNETPPSNCTVPYDGMNITGNVSLCPGDYNMNSSINFISNNAVLDCNGAVLIGNSSIRGMNLGWRGSNSTIKNCQFRNYQIGIYAEDSSYNRIINNSFFDNGYSIYLSKFQSWATSEGNIVANNNFINSTILGYHTYRNLFINNILINMPTSGFLLHDVGNSDFINNSVKQCNSAVTFLAGAYNDRFINNTFENCQYGVWLDWSSNNHYFEGNKINNNFMGIIHQPDWYGDSVNNTIIKNEIKNNSYGLYLGRSYGFYINDNLIVKNQIGISLYNSENNTIYHNNLVDNAVQINVDNSINFWDNRSEGNYWSNYDSSSEGCNDLNGNGICDNPYVINANNSDFFPFTSQNGWLNAIKIFNISLNQNWNLISIPLILQNKSVESVFGDIMNKVIVINSFESGPGGGARTYDPLLPEFSDLHEIDEKHGYWVKMNESANLMVIGTVPENKIINLETNWNLISYLCNSTKNVSEIFSGIMNKVIVINGFESGVGGGARTYDPLLPEFSDLQELKPYHGYWVKMNESAVLDYNVVC